MIIRKKQRRNVEMEQIEIIGIDHGWSNIKSISEIFSTAVKEITTEPGFYEDVLEFEGKYYSIGGNRLEVQGTKVENDNFYFLTLAGMAKELKRRKKRTATVFLAVGLPLTRFGAEKQAFIEYLSRKKEISFRYDQVEYHIRLAKVAVFPQCYAAVADKIATFPRRVLIVDIGSWTIDIMPVIDKKPDASLCVTIPKGLITCMRSINDQSIRQLNGEIDELEIQAMILREKSDIPSEYKTIIETGLKEFANKVFYSIGEYGYNLKTTPIVFVGGGAAVMKNYGNINQPNVSYNLDVRANAKGYEHLGRIVTGGASKCI